MLRTRMLLHVVNDFDPDAVVHTVGLLFDVDSGLKNLNLIVSGSRSTPGEESTYDNITRKTAENAIRAIRGINVGAQKQIQQLLNRDSNKRRTFAFVSCAEAGWPDVQYGEQVEKFAPDWLVRYLAAKRTVEARLNESGDLRSIIYRPSLIWSWDKLDVLPVIPVFNIANALGVPFVDKTVRVEDLASAIVQGCADQDISGVCRFAEVEQLSSKFRATV